MPSSRYDLIPVVLNVVTQLKPKSILDVGIGFGKYGVLFREYLDLWKQDCSTVHYRSTKLIGVEAFEEYNNPIYWVYDEIHFANIIEILDKLPAVDLLFLGDVIEHFTKEDGRKLLKEINYKTAIIITPIKVLEQGDVFNNKYEQHVSQWNIEDFINPILHATVENQQMIVINKEQ